MSRKISDNELDKMVRGVNQPPTVPRDRMWQAIDAAREGRRPEVVAPDFQRHGGRPTGMLRLAVGLAAVLVLGFALGRMTGGPQLLAPEIEDLAPALATATQPRSSTNDPRLEREVYRLAAVNHFARADFLLTDFKVRACGQDDLTEVPRWAVGMLSQTRLLLDSPAADDPGLHQLLEELEFVLAQIGGLSRSDCARDMAWIRQGLQDRSTLDRLRMMSDVNQGAL